VHLDSSAFVTDPDLVRTLQKESISIAGDRDRDRVLFYQGEEPTGLYILHRGSATLSIRCRERRIDIKVQTTAPSLVGLPSLMDGAPHAFTAVAHGGAELSFVDRNNFACMIESDTLLSLQAAGRARRGDGIHQPSHTRPDPGGGGKRRLSSAGKRKALV
jgi:CRP-like cAMP-binding protein